jgi:hypothetical protein
VFEEVKTIIAGSRSISDFFVLLDAVRKSGFDVEITEVVSGTARGVDQLGERYAGFIDLPIKRFPADWKNEGRSAGYLRNKRMGEYADALIAIWDGQSKGTKSMIEIMKKLGKRFYVYMI